jgi:hypothetical protein
VEGPRGAANPQVYGVDVIVPHTEDADGLGRIALGYRDLASHRVRLR